jgi:four helix bundle protein
MKIRGIMERTGFENLRVYRLAEDIADLIWEIVIKWDWLPQDTVGKQLIKSADSVGANIAEGTGRGSFADNRRFARIARGSLFELKHWLRRAFKRKLLTEKEVASLQKMIQELTPKLSAYIASIGKKSPASGEVISDA